MTNLFSLPVHQLAEKIRKSELTSTELCTNYIDQIKKFEKDVKAWVHFDKKLLLNKDVSEKLVKILRKVVSTKEGTAHFADVYGYDVGGKTGTADKVKNGNYTKDKINTFVSVFPIDNPKFVLLVLLDEPKPSKEHIYYYRDGRAPYKGNWRNTAGWTTVLIAGNIIEKIGPILATKY